jgi:hypothetical protein
VAKQGRAKQRLDSLLVFFFFHFSLSLEKRQIKIQKEKKRKETNKTRLMPGWIMFINL